MHSVLGIDLSKKNTGVCLMTLGDDLGITLDYIGSISVPKFDRFNKFYFVAKKWLIEEIDSFIESRKLHSDSLSVAVEYNVFHAWSSELQFYLTQELLQKCREWKIDAVGYSPNGVKSFAKQCAPDLGMKGKVDKGDMKTVYTWLRKLNPTLPSGVNHDEIDSFFIALGGILFQAYPLSVKGSGIPATPLQGCDTDNDMAFRCLKRLLDPGVFNGIWAKFVSDPALVFSGIRFSENEIPVGVQFKETLKSFQNRGYLRYNNPYFYPFRQLDKVLDLICYFLYDPASQHVQQTTEILREVHHWKGTRFKELEVKDPFDTELYLDKAGNLFFIK